MNEGLFSAYESRDEWKTLTARLAQAGCTSVYEIAEGERPFLAAALRRKTGRRWCCFAPRSWWLSAMRRTSSG